jgi:uncharacterized membrane protein YphA (DoxX/SURF4 family)
MSAENNDNQKCCSSSMAYANLILRLWVGLRLFMAGLDKFREGNGFKNVSFSMFNYNNKTERIAKLMADNSFLPEGMCYAYAKSIGFVLLAVGVWVTVGICTELGLLAAGLTFLSLGFGLAVLPDDTEVVYIGIHTLIVAAALATSKSNKFSLDGLFGSKKRD